MKAPKRQHIYIYDHPESKIRFLEQTLMGKDWRATLVYPDGTAEEQYQLEQAKLAFQKRGYQVRAAKNEYGHRTLELHHLGEGSKPSDIVREMGLAQGVGHLIMNPSVPIGAALNHLSTAFDYAVSKIKDPAHLNGLIYLAADISLAKPEKGKKFTAPKNLLRSIGFGLFLSQSLTYLFVAKDNDQSSFDEFQNKIKKTIKRGGDLTHVHYDEATDKPSEGIGQSIAALLRRYPIQAGALFNNLGMGLYTAASLLERKESQAILALGKAAAKPKAYEDALKYIRPDLTTKWHLKSGFRKDIMGAFLSIAAWTAMLISPKVKSESDSLDAPSNIFARAWNALRQNPQILGGVGTLGASAYRLAGAESRGATNQKFGEKIYIFGDIMLLFTKNDHYGKKTGNVDTLADTLAEYINKMPLILGAQSQQEMVKNMSNFLLEKGLAEIKKNPRTASFTESELKERADLLTLEVGRRVRNSYNEQMEQLGDVAARLVAQFPTDKRAALTEQLAKALPQLSWVHATPEELKPVLEKAVAHVPTCIQTDQPVTMKSVRQAVADIIAIMPEVDAGGSTALLYDALVPFMGPPQKTVAAPMPQALPTHTITNAKHVAPLVAAAAQTLHNA